jgi:hypothetical protein
VFGVVLEVSPGSEEDKFRVAGAASVFEVAGRKGKGAQAVSSSDECDAMASFEELHDVGHGADVGAAQDRVRSFEWAEFGREAGAAVKADGGLGDGEPAVGFGGEMRAEAEGLRQGEGSAVEVGHDIAGAAPVVDRLG